jgi:acylphosphatase
MRDPESLCCRRFLVTGRVQGVFFRASTRDVAVALSLSGYAKNLSDGRVEVLACGRSDAIDKLAAWLLEGPRMATVTRVEAENEPYRDIGGFSTG